MVISEFDDHPLAFLGTSYVVPLISHLAFFAMPHGKWVQLKRLRLIV